MRRGLAILAATLPLYLLTHLTGWALLPGVLVLAICHQEPAIQRLKPALVGLLFRIVGKQVKVSGWSDPQPGQNHLIASKDPGLYAGLALMRIFPQAAIAAHTFISWIPLFGHTLRQIGTVFVAPRHPQFTRRSRAHPLRSESSSSLLLFPEGRRTPDGQIKHFARGFLYLLRHSSLDLLPVTRNGFNTLKPAWPLTLAPQASLEGICHPPIPNAQTRKLSDAALTRLLENQIQSGYRP
ncbi:MAG: 1-acyl-sn-glycerol-3-phosphate acyltransferase [Anaerolineales bacterium]|nr:1-acyl-sn-glycerol-3-phosphate acyltransferase [Anaerolineales bacterium]